MGIEIVVLLLLAAGPRRPVAEPRRLQLSVLANGGLVRFVDANQLREVELQRCVSQPPRFKAPLVCSSVSAERRTSIVTSPV